jgi:hypothetical protein
MKQDITTDKAHLTSNEIGEQASYKNIYIYMNNVMSIKSIV